MPPAAPVPPLAQTGQRPEVTARITRGVRRALAQQGFASLTEYRLANGRRADVLAVNGAGTVAIVEVKSSLEDFRADQKWQDYLAYCDAFWFAVAPEFPNTLIPPDCGLMVADGYGATVLREAPVQRLAPARRKSLILGALLLAGGRLHRFEDPAAALEGELGALLG